jgi:hypothetical protein
LSADAVSPIWLDIVPTNEYAVLLDGNAVPIEENTVLFDENPVPINGNAIPIKKNAVPIDGNWVLVDQNGVPISGNSVPIDGNSLLVDGNARFKAPGPWELNFRVIPGAEGDSSAEANPLSANSGICQGQLGLRNFSSPGLLSFQ